MTALTHNTFPEFTTEGRRYRLGVCAGLTQHYAIAPYVLGSDGQLYVDSRFERLAEFSSWEAAESALRQIGDAQSMLARQPQPVAA